MLPAYVLDALLLPFALVFVMRLSADRRIMSSQASGRFLLTIGWPGTVRLVALSLLLV
jgi:Mn2+/Fe2+ NRAMP family transporter